MRIRRAALGALSILEKSPVADQFFDGQGSITPSCKSHVLAQYKSRQVTASNIIDCGERTQISFPPNLATSILHQKWTFDKNQRLPKPIIKPDTPVVGFDQEIHIMTDNNHPATKALTQNFTTGKDAANKQINFFYTLNKDEIPTPFSGEFYHQGAKLHLTKEVIGAETTQVELKVIAVQEGTLPSEVAYRCYKVKEGVSPQEI
jgi:hypothetical protein